MDCSGVDSRRRDGLDWAMQMLFGFSNLISLCAAVVFLVAAILAMRHVGQGGAILMIIGAGGQLLVSLFWTANSVGALLGSGRLLSVGPEFFGAMSILSSGALLMWAGGVVLVLIKVGGILKHHAIEREIHAREAARSGG